MKHFAILGHPVAHSLSPKLHNAVFKELGLNDYHYEVLDVLPEQLPEVLEKMRAGGYQGFSVTIPYKKTIMPLLDELSETAKKVGAVNTVIRKDDGILFGENTDYYGFRKSLEEANVEKGNALVLGSGGAAQAVIAVLNDLGFEVVVVSRKPKDSSTVSYDQLLPDADYSLIVNTTPVGMEPNVDESPLMDPRWFGPDRTYVDIIYNPKMTKFLRMAKDAGAKIVTGDRMFLWQAVEQAMMFLRNEMKNEDEGVKRVIEVMEREL